jgi:hypothetical protein
MMMMMMMMMMSCPTASFFFSSFLSKTDAILSEKKGSNLFLISDKYSIPEEKCHPVEIINAWVVVGDADDDGCCGCCCWHMTEYCMQHTSVLIHYCSKVMTCGCCCTILFFIFEIKVNYM